MSDAPNVTSGKPDFPDWLSPMLVKELRQGLRSRVFLFCMLAIQGAMILLALIGLLQASVNDDTQGITVFFWIIAGLPLVMIMPFSGLGAISREKTANTLELIFLTRLTARRIVFGKWVAIVAQTLLLVSAILPYAVMRYYVGGVDITSELAVLGWMVAGSAVLTSITVGISPAVGRVGRVLMPFGVFIALYIMLGLIFDFGGGMLSWRGDWKTVALVVIQGSLLMLLMLEVGASKIGPEAENHSTPMRLVALAAALAWVLGTYLPMPGGLAGLMRWFTMIIVVPVMVGAVCEPVREIPSVYRPFLGWGVAGRALGRLFYPGWPSGVFFALLVIAIGGLRYHEVAIGVHYFAAKGGYTQQPVDQLLLTHVRVSEVAFVGGFFLPVALFRVFWPDARLKTMFYVVAQAALGLVALVGLLFTEYGGGHQQHYSGPSMTEQVIACIPTCAFYLQTRMTDWHDFQLNAVVVGGLIFTAIELVILSVRMWPAWRAISALEKTAASLEPAESAAPDAARSDAAA